MCVTFKPDKLSKQVQGAGKIYMLSGKGIFTVDVDDTVCVTRLRIHVGSGGVRLQKRLLIYHMI